MGLKNAFKILGFEVNVSCYETDQNSPLGFVWEVLKRSSALLSPLDMGYLDYNPMHSSLYGVDHYFFIVGSQRHNQFIVHDPEGFPNVIIQKQSLEKAWNADSNPYRKRPFQFFSNPKRVTTPSRKKIFLDSRKYFKRTYLDSEKIGAQDGILTDDEAIELLIRGVKEEILPRSERDGMTKFLLQVSARRASDFSYFFRKNGHAKLKQLKQKQAIEFGAYHTFCVKKDWGLLLMHLEKINSLES
jgi:hypothetical protein